MRAVKFIVAMLFLIGAMELAIVSGAALIFGQWAAIFGQLSGDNIKTGLIWCGLGLLAAAILQFFSIKILASEPKYGWGWVVGAAIPIILISWHFGFFTISVFMCSFLAFQSYRQVPIERAKLAKRVTNNDL